MKKLKKILKSLPLINKLSKHNCYLSCNEINNFHMMFNGPYTSDNFVALCCERIANQPATKLSKTGMETFENIKTIRENLLDELKSNKPTSDTAIACTNCRKSKIKKWKNSDLIRRVGIAIYPSPCQSRCIYCLGTQNKDRFQLNSEDVKEAYNTFFETINYALENNYIAEDARWDIACGEITIHPYKEKIYELVKGKHARFSTNCFVYDENIGKNLSENPRSLMELSIDAGTPESWRKVKGFNNFDTIKENLQKYRNNCISSEQITLKYVMLPDINDNKEDFDSLIEIMQSLDVTHLRISRDHLRRYSKTDDGNEVLEIATESAEHKTKVISGTRTLIETLKKHGFTYNLAFFHPDEIDRIESK